MVGLSQIPPCSVQKAFNIILASGTNLGEFLNLTITDTPKALFIDNNNMMALPGLLENKALAVQNPPAQPRQAPGMLFPPARPAMAPGAPVLQPLAVGAPRMPEPPMYQPLPQHQQHIANPRQYANAPSQSAAQRFMNPLEQNQECLGGVTYRKQQFRHRLEQYQANSEHNQDPFAAAIHNNLQYNSRRLDPLTVANQFFAEDNDQRGRSVAEMTGNIAPARPDWQWDYMQHGNGMNGEDDSARNTGEYRPNLFSKSRS
jgi:hypothetical protein